MSYEHRDHLDASGGEGFQRGRRPVTDYGATVVHWMMNRTQRYKHGYRGERERPSAPYIVDMLPPAARPTNAADSIPVKHKHTSLNKVKHPINVVRWTPEGRRLLTASSSGEFTLWNGTGFNFETIMQAHDAAVRALCYSHDDDWLLSGDHEGLVKYWQPNFNNLQTINAHTDPIREIAFSPNNTKFVTASDDSTLKIFDFAGGVEEGWLKSHGWDVKSCDWHPTKGLVVSGSKDHLVKLWDPRSGRCLTTLHGHKNTITKTLFERVRGHCLATSARDQTARVFDLRMMRDICLLKGHDKDISTLTWHPVHANLLSTGGHDGALFHYLLDEPNTPPGHATGLAPYDSVDPASHPAQIIYPAHRIQHAHEFAIWTLDWHPLGHVLASGSNDRLTRFWTRARPGETDFLSDRFHIGDAAAAALGTYHNRGMRTGTTFGARPGDEMDVEEGGDHEVDPQNDVPPVLLSDAGGGGGGGGLIPGLLPSSSTTHLPMIPGMALPPTTSGAAPPFPPPLLPPTLAGGASMPLVPPGLDPKNPADFAKITEMMQKAGVPLPPPPPGMQPGGMPPRGMLPPGLIPPPLPGLGQPGPSGHGQSGQPGQSG